MNDPAERPLFADMREELGALGAELREMAAARWELAKLELTADLHSLKRLAIAWLSAMVLMLTALPLLAMCLAEELNGWAGISRTGWLLIFGGGLMILSAAGGYFAWWRFRRKFLGLRETLEELREDAAWLREKR
jgi:hypothetical protein